MATRDPEERSTISPRHRAEGGYGSHGRPVRDRSYFWGHERRHDPAADVVDLLRRECLRLAHLRRGS